MTGAPSAIYELRDEDAWERIYEADQKNHILCTSTHFGENDNGLIGGHAYGLIAAKTVTNSKGKLVNIVKLRNPWGEFEWNGDWSDKSECWTPELKKQVNLVDHDDGSFWISMQDFKSKFNNYCICKYVDGFNFNFNKFPRKDSGYYFVKIEVNNDGDQTFGIS